MTPKRMNTILVGMLLLLIAGTVAGVYIVNLRLTALARDTARLSADIEVSKKQINTYTLTKTKVESLDYVGGLAEKVLPESQEQSVVVAEISQFALRSYLTVAGIEFPDQPASTSKAKKKSVVPKGVEVIPVVVKFKGASYDNLLNFLKTVEGNQRKMQVNSIALKPDEDNRTVLSEVAVSMNLYVKKAADQEKKQ